MSMIAHCTAFSMLCTRDDNAATWGAGVPCGYTDMRKGMATLAMLVQQALGHDPFSGAIYAFRGRRSGLIKVLWHDGVGMCLFIKRLERGQWECPANGGRRNGSTIGRVTYWL